MSLKWFKQGLQILSKNVTASDNRRNRNLTISQDRAVSCLIRPSYHKRMKEIICRPFYLVKEPVF